MREVFVWLQKKMSERMYVMIHTVMIPYQVFIVLNNNTVVIRKNE